MKTIKFNVNIAVDGKTQVENATKSIFSLNQAIQGLDSVKSSVDSICSAMQGLAAPAQAAQQANVKLTTVMKQRMAVTEADINQINKLIGAQTQMGVVGGTVQKAAAQQVGTFLTQKQSLSILIPAMNDLIAQQKGLNATEQDAQAIGNLFGKVMQGQTSALRRVGITFTEAQEKVLKMGTEQERAAMLAEVVTNNVGHMNAALGKTDAGKQKQLAAQLGSVKVKIGNIVQQGLPFVSFAAMTLSFASSTVKLFTSLGALKTMFLGVKTIVLSLASGVIPLYTKSVQLARFAMVSMRALGVTLRASFVALRAGTITLSGAFRGLAVGATTAKMAIRGLVSATLVGAVLTALSFAVEALMNWIGKLVDTTDEETEALDRNSQAITRNDRVRSAVGKVQSDAQEHHAEERNKLQQLTEVIHNNSAALSTRLRAIKNLQAIVPQYQATIAKDGTLYERNADAVDKYIKKLDDLAMAEAAFDMIRDLNKQILQVQVSYHKVKTATEAHEARRDALYKQGGIDPNHPLQGKDALHNAPTYQAPSALDVLTGKADNVLPTKTPGSYKALTDQIAREDKQIAVNQKNLLDLGDQYNNLTAQKSAIFKSLSPGASASYYTIAANGGYTQSTPELYTPGTGSGTTHTPKPDKTDKPEPEPDEKSLEWYDREIQKQKQLAQSTANLTTAKEAMAEATRLEAKRHDLAIKIGIEAPEKKEARNALEQLQDQLREAQTQFDSATTIQAKVKASTRIAELQQQINVATSGELTIPAKPEPTYITKGSIEDRRQSYQNAQSRAAVVRSDYQTHLIDKKQAQAQIDEINAMLTDLGKDIPPIELEVKADTRHAEAGISEYMQKATDAVSQFGSSLGQLGSAIQLPELNVAGTLAQAIATLTASYATATAQSASMGPFAWIAFAAAGLAQLAAIITSVKSLNSGSYATGGIVPGTSYSGDHLIAHVNSGEMILNPRQQQALWRMANTPITAPAAATYNPTTIHPTQIPTTALEPRQLNLTLTSRITGRDLQLVLDKRQKLTSRT